MSDGYIPEIKDLSPGDMPSADDWNALKRAATRNIPKEFINTSGGGDGSSLRPFELKATLSEYGSAAAYDVDDSDPSNVTAKTSDPVFEVHDCMAFFGYGKDVVTGGGNGFRGFARETDSGDWVVVSLEKQQPFEADLQDDDLWPVAAASLPQQNLKFKFRGEKYPEVTDGVLSENLGVLRPRSTSECGSGIWIQRRYNDAISAYRWHIITGEFEKTFEATSATATIQAGSSGNVITSEGAKTLQAWNFTGDDVLNGDLVIIQYNILTHKWDIIEQEQTGEGGAPGDMEDLIDTVEPWIHHEMVNGLFTISHTNADSSSDGTAYNPFSGDPFVANGEIIFTTNTFKYDAKGHVFGPSLASAHVPLDLLVSNDTWITNWINNWWGDGGGDTGYGDTWIINWINNNWNIFIDELIPKLEDQAVTVIKDIRLEGTKIVLDKVKIWPLKSVPVAAGELPTTECPE